MRAPVCVAALLLGACAAGAGGAPPRRTATTPATTTTAQTTVVDAVPGDVVPRIDAAMKTRLRGILARGGAAGMRPDVFAKVGDSITQDPAFLTAFGCGLAHYGNHGSLARVVERFSRVELPPDPSFAPCDAANAFTRRSAAVRHGWTSADLLRPLREPRPGCRVGVDRPIGCEIARIRPGIALVMIGTNDTGIRAEPDRFEANLRRVLDELVVAGVIPVVSTIPHRFFPRGAEGRVGPYNEAIRRVASDLGIPLWDYWRALDRVKNKGMSYDGLHPSAYGNGADLRPEALGYGYNIRNLTALQVLGHLAAVVLDDGPPDPGGVSAA